LQVKDKGPLWGKGMGVESMMLTEKYPSGIGFRK